MLGLILGIGGPALAGDLPAPPEAERAAAPVPEDPEADRGLFGSGKGPAETIEDKLEEKSEEERARDERLQKIDDANRTREARVVVLQWPNTDTDYTNEALQRNIKARIARPNSKFFPDYDLYQEGRTEPDHKMVRPEDQRAVVPDSVIPRVMAEVEATSAIPFDAITENDWGVKGQQLLDLSDELWFIDRQELREPLFLLYAQIGRAGENSNQNSPPYYVQIDDGSSQGQSVNYFWYLAATLAYADPTLMSKLTDQDLYTTIDNYRNMIDSGVFKKLTIGFASSNRNFDPKAFGGDFEVYVNGSSTLVTDANGLLEVPLGRTDIYLKRADGHSLSAREERTKIPQNYTLLLQIAQTRMGENFIQQLMENPYECTPLLSGDIVNYLSVYAKLHPNSDVYIAVPKNGSTSPGRIFLWRWDRERAQLFLVQDNTGGFPVRFAAVIGAGIAFGGVQLEDPQGTAGDIQPPEPGQEVEVGALLDGFAPSTTLTPEGAPIFYQLRGHFNRLFMGVGMQYKPTLMGGPYQDFFQTRTQDQQFAVKFGEEQDPTTPTTTPTTGTPPAGDAQDIALRQVMAQRLVYGMIGVMLGKDAGVGFGPRGYLRYGWYNAPHAIDLTGHVGITSKAPGSPKDDVRMGRVRALLDLDFFGGVLLPFRDSLFLGTQQGFMVVGKPQVTFGFTAGAGLTF